MEDPRSQSLGSRGAQYTKLGGHSGYGSTGGRHDGDLEKEGDDDPDAYPAASPCCRSNRECCCCFFGCCCSFSTVLIIVGLVYFVIARAKPIHHTVQVRFYIFFHTSLSHVWTRYWEGERGSIRMGVATASAEHARAHCAFLSVAHSSLPAPPRPHRGTLPTSRSRCSARRRYSSTGANPVRLLVLCTLQPPNSSHTALRPS